MHRDIKPDNILMKSDNQNDIVIVDFGLATLINENINIQNILFKKCGTPGYTAPEILLIS